jgi:hypothetical protein
LADRIAGDPSIYLVPSEGLSCAGTGPQPPVVAPPQCAARLLEPQLMNVMTDNRTASNGDLRCGDELFPSGVPNGRAEESSC